MLVIFHWKLWWRVLSCFFVVGIRHRQLLPDCPCPIVNMVNLMLGYCWLRYLYSILGADR